MESEQLATRSWSVQILGGDPEHPIPLQLFDAVSYDMLLEIILFDSRHRTLKKFVVGPPGGVIQAPPRTESLAYRWVPRKGRRLAGHR